VARLWNNDLWHIYNGSIIKYCKGNVVVVWRSDSINYFLNHNGQGIRNYKMTFAKNVFLFLLIFTLIFTISCSKKECEKTLDCDQKRCFTVSCDEGVCNYEPKENCCGNDIKEELEDGKPGNECTCPQDYGRCDKSEGDYLERYCKDEECVPGVDEENIKRVKLSNDKALSPCEINIYKEYDEPFIVGKSNILIKFTIIDIDNDIKPPIIITKLRLFESGEDYLLGEKDVNLKLAGIGDEASTELNFSYDMDKSEEEKKIKLVMNYQYNQPEREKVDDEYVMIDKIYRKDYSETFPDKFIIVNPSMI